MCRACGAELGASDCVSADFAGGEEELSVACGDMAPGAPNSLAAGGRTIRTASSGATGSTPSVTGTLGGARVVPAKASSCVPPTYVGTNFATAHVPPPDRPTVDGCRSSKTERTSSRYRGGQ